MRSCTVSGAAGGYFLRGWCKRDFLKNLRAIHSNRPVASGVTVAPGYLWIARSRKAELKKKFQLSPDTLAENQPDSFRFMKYHAPAPITAMPAIAIGSAYLAYTGVEASRSCTAIFRFAARFG